MADIADEVEDYIEDFGHQGCYIFKPSVSSSCNADDRPKKKRKTAKDASSTIDAWPRLCGGAEPLEHADLRRKAFRSVWSQHEERIRQISNTVDDNVLNEVDDFIQADDGSSDGLKTGFIVVGPDRNAQTHLLDHLKGRQESTRKVLIQLRASQAPNLQTALKNIIRTAIETHSSEERYISFLSSHKQLLPLNFDLELLQEYISLNQIEKVIVLIQDAETFDTSILAELLSSLSSWTVRIPFIVLLGIATTIDLFESRLSRSVVRLLSATIFDLTSNEEDKIYQMFCAIQSSPHTGPYLGLSTTNTLLELTQDQTNTTSTFIRGLKYSYMSHYFANPLSVLLAPDTGDSVDISTLCEAIRNTPSFQTYCSTLLNQGKSRLETVRNLLNNDTFLITESQTAVNLGAENVRQINEQIQVIVTLYKYLIPSRESSLALHLQLQQSRSSSATLVDSEIYLTLTEKLKALSSNDLLSLVSTQPDVFCRIIPGNGTPELNRSISTLHKNYSVTSIQLIHSTSHPNSTGRSKSTLNSTSTQAETEYAAILDSLTTSLDTCLNSTSSSPFNNTTDTIQPLFLSEAFIHNARSPLHPTLLPRPRFALERALRIPSDYLGCECCVNPANNHPQPSNGIRRDTGITQRAGEEASSVLFKLLDEAGREVNVRDLWDAFLNVMLPTVNHGPENADGETENQVDDALDEEVPHGRNGRGKATPKPKPKTSGNDNAKVQGKAAASTQKSSTSQVNEPSPTHNPSHNTQRDVETPVDDEHADPIPDPGPQSETPILALFYTALAELKILGLIKPSSSTASTSSVGASTTQRVKAVDVISRVVWSGL